MTRIFEWFTSVFFESVTFFKDIGQNRFDAPLVAEHKAKKRIFLLSFIPYLVLPLIAWPVGRLLNGVSRFSGAAAAVSTYRDAFDVFVIGALAISAVFTLWTWLSLAAFKKHNQIR